MEYSEDEQLEKLKAWWKSYGNALMAGIVLGLAILFGGKYWHHYQDVQAANASVLYDQMIYLINDKKNNDVSSIGNKIIKDYSSTPYAGLAALILAKQNYDRKEVAKAKNQLAWAIDNAKEKGVSEVARLRLARIQLSENNVAGAEVLLKKDPVPGFELEYYELQGDFLKKKGDKAGARTAYGKAMAHAANAGKYIETLQMKIDDLG